MNKDKTESDQIILATGGYDHTIKLWQTHTGICQRTMQHGESQINALKITPDKKHLTTASYQHIYMYDLTSNNQNAIINYEGTSKNVTCVGFNADGRWMYSGGEDGRARIWDIRSRNNSSCPKIFEVQAPITCICLHPNQVELFMGDQNGVIYRWDLRTNTFEELIPEPDAMILDLDIDATCNYMASVNNKGRCYIWSLEYGSTDTPTNLQPKHKFEAHKKHALKCNFSPNSEYLITTSADQTAKIWSVPNFTLLQELKQDSQRWVWDAAFSADSQYVFTASSDCYARLWNVNTGVMERHYAGHQKAVTALALMDVAAS
ncbi:unnamed protein product [Brassicogethes aeneus]|uniref:Target of rapamycin complex subunit lst8 n=1 Tax=Brassicogethes aeneus TaxID=1431903 RepID=A0A9P0FFM2_BRAAE|nr:unnamed protein product [Brassicogethes aeneus]